MKYLLIAVLALSALSVSLKAFGGQKIIFCGETSSYRPVYKGDDGAENCNKVCAGKTRDCGLNDLLVEGWKIDANMAKTIPMPIPEPIKVETSFMGICSCNGTQYVLSKVEKKIEVAPEPDKNLELLKKEIELLKKENDMLKKDGEALKQENEALKTKVKKKK